MPVVHRRVPDLERPPGYSDVVTSTGGTTVWLAGQLARDSDGTLVGRGDLQAQTQKVLDNLVVALGSVGATARDLVRTTVYVVTSDPSELEIVWEVIAADERLELGPAASTLVGVTALGYPDHLVEIDAVAVVEGP